MAKLTATERAAIRWRAGERNRTRWSYSAIAPGQSVTMHWQPQQAELLAGVRAVGVTWHIGIASVQIANVLLPFSPLWEHCGLFDYAAIGESIAPPRAARPDTWWDDGWNHWPLYPGWHVGTYLEVTFVSYSFREQYFGVRPICVGDSEERDPP